MQNKYISLTWALVVVLIFSACQEAEYTLPESKIQLQNDCIKRTLGPNIVGLDIEFVYAMALGFDQGNITKVEVESNIPGATGTYLDHRSYHTNPSGQDIGIAVADPAVTSGTKTQVTFTKDTCAASLRYYYIIPEEARGKSVSFTFSVSASTGESLSYSMGPYTIAKTEMKRDIILSDNSNCYLSIADMMTYDAAGAANNPDKIDLLYLYRPITGINFNHALVSPAANTDFLPGITLPSGVNKSTKMHQTNELRDFHLAHTQYGIYIDDLDFQELDISDAANYCINLRAEMGAWVETADGKYRAFIYVNSVNNSGKEMTVSIKRYTMK